MFGGLMENVCVSCIWMGVNKTSTNKIKWNSARFVVDKQTLFSNAALLSVLMHLRTFGYG